MSDKPLPSTPEALKSLRADVAKYLRGMRQDLLIVRDQSRLADRAAWLQELAPSPQYLTAAQDASAARSIEMRCLWQEICPYIATAEKAFADLVERGEYDLAVKSRLASLEGLLSSIDARDRSGAVATTPADERVYTADDLPAEYRDGGRATGKPLTSPYVEHDTDWLLSPGVLKGWRRRGLRSVPVVIDGKRMDAHEFEGLAARRRLKTAREDDDG